MNSNKRKLSTLSEDSQRSDVEVKEWEEEEEEESFEDDFEDIPDDDSTSSKTDGEIRERSLSVEVDKSSRKKKRILDPQDIKRKSLERRGSLSNREIILGVCSLEKKSNSGPMKEILSRIKQLNYIKVILFDDDTILNKPIEEWPLCDALISFFSIGFPLKKAIEYADLRKPFLINDLKAQELLLDRRTVYSILEKHGVPTPRHAVLNRDKELATSLIVEEDTIYVNGMRFDKPFVEKPVDSDDHNIIIYYPRSAGGGSQHLFRKVGDRSSQYQDDGIVRMEGSYMYEDFLTTQGTDVKVYTVGPSYYHAEARKAPSLDGKVNRGSNGREVRFPIVLTAEEKEIALKITLAFKQNVCGFDLLRADGKSYVCDVNGWSFVKNSVKYYEDCAQIIHELILRKLAPARLSLTQPILGPLRGDKQDEKSSSRSAKEELRCVIAVTRHGDRTPKQKMKMVVKSEAFLSFFTSQQDPKKEVKLKSAVQLQRVLDITRSLLAARTGEEDSDNEESTGKLEQMKAVLEKGGHFSGINRKVQLKPLKWGESKDARGEVVVYVKEALLILKWGGELTTAGKAQAEKLGHHFRKIMYPGENGLLRLHSTYRHDLKIYASDEGRVQMTAAAFSKGFLDLEGELTPILVSLVIKDKNSYDLLDDSSGADEQMKAVKKKLFQLLTSNEEVYPEKIAQYVPTLAQSLVESIKAIGNPLQALHKVKNLFESVTSELKRRVQTMKHEQTEIVLYEGESLSLMQKRYQKLDNDFYKRKKDTFDISKIPDIYDCVKYDLIHNQSTLNLKDLQELYDSVKPLADFTVPQEYGMTASEKKEIGHKICKNLVEKILVDLNNSRKSTENFTETMYRLDPRYSKEIKIKMPGRHVRTRLYFTSESHIQSLLNTLRYGNGQSKIIQDDSKIQMIDELNYLTMFVFRLFERTTPNKNEPYRYRVAVSFSQGISTDMNKRENEEHVLPLEPLFDINTSMSLKEFEEYLTFSTPSPPTTTPTTTTPTTQTPVSLAQTPSSTPVLTPVPTPVPTPAPTPNNDII